MHKVFEEYTVGCLWIVGRGSQNRQGKVQGRKNIWNWVWRAFCGGLRTLDFILYTGRHLSSSIRWCVSLCLNVAAHVWESVCLYAPSCKSKCLFCLSGGPCVSACVSVCLWEHTAWTLLSGSQPPPHHLLCLLSLLTLPSLAEIKGETKTQVWNAGGSGV